MDFMHFKRFMNDTLALICEYIGADKKTIFFCVNPAYNGEGTCFDTEVALPPSSNPASVILSICCESTMDPVIYCAMQVIDRQLKINSMLNPHAESGWFYNSITGHAHTPETFARDIYGVISAQVLERYDLITGIDLNAVGAIMQESYEGNRVRGALAFVRDATVKSILRTEIEPQAPIQLNIQSKRHIRKLLEGAGDDVLVLGYDDVHRNYCCIGYADRSHLNEFPCSVTAGGRHTWTFRCARKDVFRVRMGGVLCMQNSLEICLTNLKKELDETLISSMRFAIESISKQSHGTSVIFLDLSQESVRNHIEMLERQHRALRIKPLLLTGSDDRSDLKKLAGVDGALIVNYPQKQIEYINVIVDGKAIIEGDPASGARKNVVSCFIANLAKDYQNVRAAALIFSEDGHVTLVRASDYSE